MSHLRLFIVWVAVGLLWAMALPAWALPKPRPVRIEVRHQMGFNRLMYFWLTDLYTKEERKVRSEYGSADDDPMEVLDFELYHPLYGEIVAGSNRRIPFYVEPGDTLTIYLEKNWRVSRYERSGGRPMKYERLLRHDLSLRTFYAEADFQADRERCRFPEFVGRMTAKMGEALDSVDHVADVHHFSEEERRMARCNVQLQFALWLFEFEPYKALQLDTYGERHQSGWQMSVEQDADIEATYDIGNYAFLRQMPIDDSLCLASPFFPRLIQSYESAQVLCRDLYRYEGYTASGMARADSAYMAQEQAITHRDRPSLWMRMAMQRKQAKEQPLVDDGSVLLPEVQVVESNNLDQFYKTFGRSEYDPKKVVEKAWAPTVNLRGPISSLFNRKKIRRYKRALKLVEQLGADDAEREALLKAWEESEKEKGKVKSEEDSVKINP